MARSQLDFTMVDLAKLYPAATPETCRPALPRPRAHRGTNGGQVLDRRRCHRVALQQFDDVTGPSASARPPRPRRRTATPASASLQLGAPPSRRGGAGTHACSVIRDGRGRAITSYPEPCPG